jgi:hypothetical protein
MKDLNLKNECEIISHNINWFKGEKEMKNKRRETKQCAVVFIKCCSCDYIELADTENCIR